MNEMAKKGEKSSSLDIFQLLTEATEKRRKKKREEILAPLGIKEFFVDGSIVINKLICQGIECKLCIDVCPTNALFWRAGEVGIIEELCIYCSACVLSCIVDDCMKVARKRPTGEVETFSKPTEVLLIQNHINAKKRFERTRGIYPEIEVYLERHRPPSGKNRQGS